MRVYIYACDNIYGGLHGMEDYGIFEVANMHEADAIGEEMSRGVVDSYSQIMESIEEDCAYYVEHDGFEESSSEWEGIMEQLIAEDLNWSVCEIDEDRVNGMTDEELETEASNLGFESFVKRYCKEQIFMTNAEKYEETFGFKPDVCSCPTYSCRVCPERVLCDDPRISYDWWNSEYVEPHERNL